MLKNNHNSLSDNKFEENASHSKKSSSRSEHNSLKNGSDERKSSLSNKHRNRSRERRDRDEHRERSHEQSKKYKEKEDSKHRDEQYRSSKEKYFLLDLKKFLVKIVCYKSGYLIKQLNIVIKKIVFSGKNRLSYKKWSKLSQFVQSRSGKSLDIKD